MKALILGDSQTGYTGKEIEKILEPRGFVVTRSVNSGESTEWLAEKAKDFPRQWDAVFILSGGNDGKVMAESLTKLLGYFSPSTVRVYIPLPPATVITDMPLAKKVWKKASTPQKFFPQTGKFREEKRDAYVTIAQALDWTVKDPRDAGASGAVVQPSGVVYPSQPDGIHTDKPTSIDVAKYATSLQSDSWFMPLALGAAVGLVVYFLKRDK